MVEKFLPKSLWVDIKRKGNSCRKRKRKTNKTNKTDMKENLESGSDGVDVSYEKAKAPYVVNQSVNSEIILNVLKDDILDLSDSGSGSPVNFRDIFDDF